MLPSYRQYHSTKSKLSLRHAANDDDEDNEKARRFKTKVRYMIWHASPKEANTKLQLIMAKTEHYMKISGMDKVSLHGFVDELKQITSDELTRVAKDATLHVVDTPKPTPLLRQPELSNFEKNLTEKMFTISTKEAKRTLEKILRNLKTYSIEVGMPEDSLREFVHGLKRDFC